ncbi:hypothetical protein ACIQAC_01405 [Streptomyces sp. NPDC088387]|uniref:hypothetical protein n=1 Tax=Streptomyces sp. NPDC088387 TaxID=3365859 RepID=UPI0037F5C532
MTDPYDGLARKVFRAETAAVRAHLAEQSPTAKPRLFHLQRDHDVSGVSGTGRVANGVLWPDGTVSLRWIGERPSTVHWDRLADAEHVHGHGGATRILWADEQPDDVVVQEPERLALAHRAAVLREAAEAINALPQDYECDPGRGDAAELLRRMADGAQQP